MKLYFDLIDEYNLNLPFRRSIVTPVYSIGNSNLFVIIIPLFEPVAAPRDNHFMGAILVFCDINDFIKFFPESNIPTLLEQNGQVLLSNNESFIELWANLNGKKSHDQLTGLYQYTISQTHWNLISYVRGVGYAYKFH